MKAINITFLLIIIFTQVSFSQIQVSCGGISNILGTNGMISSLNMNDCLEDLEIRIDESLLLDNENITLEGAFELDSGKSIRIIGNQNHTIFIRPFERDVTYNKKVLAYKGGLLPDEEKTVIKTSRYDSKRSSSKVESIVYQNLTIYPNPATTNITIQTQETILIYKVINPQGTIILQEYFPDSNTIDISNLNNGMYYIKIQTLQQVVTKQLIKN
jgi:hypothetical protein